VSFAFSSNYEVVMSGYYLVLNAQDGSGKGVHIRIYCHYYGVIFVVVLSLKP